MASCDHLYLLDRTLWTMGRVVLIPWRGFVLVFVISFGSVGVSFLDIFLQLPFPDELLYLLLQVSAIFCVVAVILMETSKLLLITHIG